MNAASADAARLQLSISVAETGLLTLFLCLDHHSYLRNYISPIPLMFIALTLSTIMLIIIVTNFYISKSCKTHIFQFGCFAPPGFLLARTFGTFKLCQQKSDEK